MHYNSDLTLAFGSVEHIMRDVSGGWFLRYLHANGASAFFGVVYLHLLRGLLYQSYGYPHRGVWLSGVAIFVLMMATAFIGYVLPWGQMSFWGATVITNLFSVLPVVGPDLVYWIWGGFSVGGATLSRFFSLHYLLPFGLVALALLHLQQLHGEGSSNPFGPEHREVGGTFSLPLYPYFMVKDLLGLLVFGAVFSYFLFFNPNLLGHSDNYIEANSMVTPEHIVPEWYFRAPKWALDRSGAARPAPLRTRSGGRLRSSRDRKPPTPKVGTGGPPGGASAPRRQGGTGVAAALPHSGGG
jgi:ubiquinol-cytochrome c reductase cytochrome b/c1 subunit